MALGKFDRREALTTSVLALSGAYCRSRAVAASSGGKAFPSSTSASSTVTIKKSLKFQMFQEEGLSVTEKFRILKEIGFDGVEINSPSGTSREEIIAARDESGLEIPGVLNSLQWDKPLSDGDPGVRQQAREALETSIRDAAAYGSSTVLLVPAVVTKEVSYEQAYSRSQAQIRAVLPLAAELGVKIAIENVWNQFLFSPMEMARYIDEFHSPSVGAYFDVGNCVTFGWPEQWIQILGSRILKLDIKEYSREKRDKEGPYAGFRVPLGEGDCDWPIVVKALEEIGYSGWGSAEVKGGDRERLREISNRMDRILPTLH